MTRTGAFDFTEDDIRADCVEIVSAPRPVSSRSDEVTA